jgi:hypothetical protein
MMVDPLEEQELCSGVGQEGEGAGKESRGVVSEEARSLEVVQDHSESVEIGQDQNGNVDNQNGNVEVGENQIEFMEVGQNRSENPETGQSEVIGEELLVTSSHGDAEGMKAEDDSPVTVQLEQVEELMEVSELACGEVSELR